MNSQQLLGFTVNLAEQLPVLYSFILLIVRYGAMLFLLPGIGLGDRGLLVRAPAACVLAFATLYGTPTIAPIPNHWLMMIGSVLFETLFGAALSLIPMMIVAGAQMAAGIASTTMGLSAASLFDPTTASQVPDLARIFGDLAVITFLAVGGHYAVIYAASGLGTAIIPGGGFDIADAAQLLSARSGEIFVLSVKLSAPIVVALLLTQFVMGLVSKAVPTVNIFIVSFPLTIGIGLILSMLVLPEVVAVLRGQFIHLGPTLEDLVSLRQV